MGKGGICSYLFSTPSENFSTFLTLSQTSPGFTCLQYKSLENAVGKGENARNKQFLLFPTMFSTRLENFLPFSSNLKLSSANSFSLEEFKICRMGKGLERLVSTHPNKDQTARSVKSNFGSTLFDEEMAFSNKIP